MRIDKLANKQAHDDPIDTNASPSAYGWCFQAGAGITLVLNNVNKFTSLKMEGASDDIELTLDTGKIYAQAKSVTQIGDQRSAFSYKIDIFTSNLKAKSGAILHKMVFIYKLAYIKLLSQKLGYPIPIFAILRADVR